MEILSFDPLRVAAVMAFVAMLVQGLKKVFELLAAWEGAPEWVHALSAWWAHGVGPAIIAALVSLCTVVLPPIVEDGRLTIGELQVILQALGIGGGATLLYWLTRFKGPFTFLARVVSRK